MRAYKKGIGVSQRSMKTVNQDTVEINTTRFAHR
jgi:hypothetical protein